MTKHLLLCSLLLSLCACDVDLYRSVDDARVSGQLTVTNESGEVVSIVDGELVNGPEAQNQVLCAVPSLIRGDVPLLMLSAGPTQDLELILQSVGDPVDADTAQDSPPDLAGSISFQARNLEGFDDQPCTFELDGYDEGGSAHFVMSCMFRDIDTDERFTLAGDITTRDCFRDRELTFQSGNVIEGLFNAAQGPDNESLRELTTVAVVVPVVAGALFFAGGHGGFH